MAHRHELTAVEWARVAPLLPARETGDTYYEDRRHAAGCTWRDVPERYGPWSTVASRQRRRTPGGVWDRVLAALQREVADAGRIDWELWCVDGSHVRAHKSAADAGDNLPAGEPREHALGRSRGGFTTELHLVTGAMGLPLAVALSAGQAHERAQHAARVLDAVRVGRSAPGRPRHAPPRSWLWRHGVRAGIPGRRDRVKRHRRRPGRKPRLDRARYRRRSAINYTVRRPQGGPGRSYALRKACGPPPHPRAAQHDPHAREAPRAAPVTPSLDRPSSGESGTVIGLLSKENAVMKTVVCQSFRTTNVPAWTASCMESVRSWAAYRGYDYEFLDDAFLEFAPEWYRANAGDSKLLVSDLARLIFMREMLSRGYDRAIWMDADVLIFDPDRFDVTVVTEYAFTREVFIWQDPLARAGERGANAGAPDIWVQMQVNNAVSVFVRGNSFLDFYVHACLSIVERMTPATRDVVAVGTKWLTVLSNMLVFPLVDGVGHICPDIMRELANGPGRLVRLFASLHGQPVYAANLNGNLVHRQAGQSPDEVYAGVVENLLRTRGAIINGVADTAVPLAQ